MTISKAKIRTIIGAAIFAATGSNTMAQEVGPECRGVAAGVVAAMKSSGEISSAEAASASIVAARRACAAALEGELEGTAGSSNNSDNKQQTTASKKSADDSSSVWDFLTRDKSDKGGHDRLRRLKTQ